MKKYITTPTSDNYHTWHDNSAYIDKTDIIIKLKGALGLGSALFFARPRRWGKSLFMSTLKHFFDRELYKEEYFSNKKIWEDEELRKRAGTYFTISLDLKPLFDRDSKKLDFDNLWIQLFKQIPEDIYKKIFNKEKPFFDSLFLEDINSIKDQMKFGQFLKSFIESYYIAKP